MDKEKYILYRVNGKFTTVPELVSNDSLFVGLSYSDLLKIKDKNGYSNLERIYAQYGYLDSQKYKQEFEQALGNIDTDIPITWKHLFVPGTSILIPKDSINRAVAARDGGAGQLETDTNYKPITDAAAFMGDKIEQIIQNPGYAKMSLGEQTVDGAFTKKEFPYIRVMVWSRSMGKTSGLPSTKVGTTQDIDSHGLQGKWIDVSRYILNVSTSTDDNGGNFSITLPPIQGEYSKSSQSWEVDKSTVVQHDGEVTAKSSLFTKDIDGLRRTEFFFKNVLSNNDIVFISFEPLESEWEIRRERMKRGDNIIEDGDWVNPTEGEWDMIGLVDNVTQVVQPGSNEVSIQVSGRDLSKLVLDDGSYMFPILFDEHNFINKDSKLVKRNLFTDSYNFYAEPRYRTVQEAVTWIINVVSNIRIIPESALQGRGGTSQGIVEIHSKKRSLNHDLQYGKKSEGQRLFPQLLDLYPGETANLNLDGVGIMSWERLYTVVSNLIETAPQDKQIEIFYKDYKGGIPEIYSMPASASEKVVEYRGARISGVYDTGSSSKSTILEIIKCMYDYHDLSKAEKEDVEIVESVGGGIWSWVKLIFDETIENRKLADVSLGRPDGSLINLIWNYAQAPWIEFHMDTWGADFYFIFRTPPLNKKLVREHLRKGWVTNVVVDSVDVLSESLSFDTEAYTMYQIDYKAGAWGTSDMLASVIPTILFPELAEIWGNKRLRVSTNMLPFTSQEDSSSALNRSYLRDRGIDDLIFVVDTTIYKPFTRKGTIIVNGDRRLKKGTWFYYKPTNEIFYILSVTQSYSSSIDRTTVIQVERGMVLDYVTGDRTINVNGKDVELSYFNIVDTERMSSRLRQQLNTKESQDTEEGERGEHRSDVVVHTNSSSDVNRAVLNFFLERRQFGGSKVVIRDE